MAGGGGSTGGIGAQSPAVNPPTTGFGQAGNAFAGQLGNIGATALGGTQQPIQQDTSSMGGMAPGFGPAQQQMGFGQAGNAFAGQLGNIGATALGGAQQPPPPFMGNFASSQPLSPANIYPETMGFGQTMQQPPPPPFMGSFAGGQQLGAANIYPETMGSQIQDSMQQARQLMTPEKMAMMQYASEQAQQGQGPMGLGQAAQTGALTPQQMSKLGGLAALLGGNPTPPTPTGQPRPAPAMAPNPGRPAPVASKSTTKTSVVPPRTPPAVASAIQKLAAKKPTAKR